MNAISGIFCDGNYIFSFQNLKDGRSVGAIFQLLPSLTAIEHILLAMDYGKRYPFAGRPERAMQLLELK